MINVELVVKLKQNLPESIFKQILRQIYRFLDYGYFFVVNNYFSIEKSQSDNSHIIYFNKEPLEGERLIIPSFYDFYQSFLTAKEVLSYFLPKINRNNFDIILDIGAFPGDFSILAYRIYRKPIYAFEPNPYLYQYLLETLYLNQVKNVEPLEIGISQYSGKAYFLLDNASSRIIKDSEKSEKIINVVSIDDFLKEKRNLPLIKMDIEGHEIEAIKGAEKTLKLYPPWLIAAYHLIEGEHTYRKLVPFFDKYGYKTSIVYPPHLILVAQK